MNSATQMNSGFIGQLENLLSRQAIFDCLQRVSRGIDRFDRESFLSAYHSDAVIDAGSLVNDGIGMISRKK